MKKLILILVFVIAGSIGVEAQHTPPRPPAPPHPSVVYKKKPSKKVHKPRKPPHKKVSSSSAVRRAELRKEHERRVKARPAPRRPAAPPLPPRP